MKVFQVSYFANDGQTINDFLNFRETSAKMKVSMLKKEDDHEANFIVREKN